MAVEKFTGELDPVDGPSVTLFKGELDPVSEPSVSLFKGKLDDPEPKPKPKPEVVVPTPEPIPAPVVAATAPSPVTTPAPVAAAPTPTTQIPQDSPPYDPAYAELSAYEPSFIDRLGRMLGLGGNRDAASVELAARRIAKAQGITVGEVYKQAGGSRDIFNPEGRATLPAIGEASAVAGESLQDVPISFANTALRAIRGGDITGGEDSFLDYAIKKTTAPDRKVDKNYEDLGGLGKSLGYSFATMGASILASVGAGLVTANPLVAGATAMGTSGAVSYRASKDEFLDRVRDNLDAKIKQVYDRPMTKEEWQSVRGDFESAASKYGAWEAIPEAVGNMFMVKAFSAPAKGMTKPMLNKLVERTAALGVENIGETATGFGGRKAEIEAGLSNEELSIKDAFKQQFLSTALLGGTMAAGAKGSQMATSFYQKYVEPKVNPESALGRAIMDDLNSVVADPESARRQAIDALDPNQKVAPTSMEDMAGARTMPPVAPVTPNAEPPEQEKPDLNSPVVATTRTEVGGKESVKTTRADGSVDVDGVLVTPATKQTAPEQPAPPAQPVAKPVNYIDTETGEIVPSDQADPKVKYINQETGEVVPPVRIEPTMGKTATPEIEQQIQTEAARYAKTYNLPLDLATDVIRGQHARGELDVERAPAKSVTGRIEPSIFVPEQGAATTEGVAPSDTTGLARPVEDTESPVGREEAEPAALGEIPTLTERAPAVETPTEPTPAVAAPFAELPKAEKDTVMGEAKNLYQSREISLPIEKSWDNLPEWKHELFAERLYNGGVDFASDPEQVYKARQEIANLENNPAAPVATPVEQAQTKLAEAETAVAEATTPDEKKDATKQRNVARQKVKQAQAAAPVVTETATVETPAAVEELNNTQEEKTEAQLEVEEEAREEAFQAQAENEIDLGEIGKVIARIENGDFENKNQIRSLINKLEKNGILDDVESVREGLSDREQLADDVLSTLSDVLEEAKDNAISERVDELRDEYEVNKEIETQAKRDAVIDAAKKAETPIAAETPVVKPKRGAPVKPKTPEEQTKYEADRRAQQKQMNQAANRVTSLINLLSKNVDTTTLAKRKDAIDQLNKFATGPETRTKDRSGKRAKAFLAQSDKVTATERAALANRLSLEKAQIPKPLAAYAQTTSKPVKAFYKFTRATQALNHIMRNGTPFERALAVRLKPFLDDVRLVIADDNTHPNIVKMLTGTDKGISASGAYSSRVFGDDVRSMIVLRGENFGNDPSRQGVNNIIFLHEALHAATEAKIAEYRKLIEEGKPVPIKLEEMMLELQRTMDVAKAEYEKLKASGAPISPSVRHAFETVGIANFPEEFVAYGLTNPDIQEFLFKAPGELRQDRAIGFWKNLFSRFVNTIRAAFDMDSKHQSALQDLMLITEGIMQQQEAAPAGTAGVQLAAKVSKSDKALENTQISIQSSEVPKWLGEAGAVRTFANYKVALEDNWGAMSDGVRERVLAPLPTSDIIRWKGDQIPAFKDIDLVTQYMSGMRQNMLSAYSKPADALGKFARKNGKAAMDTLATAMHLARLESVSPTLFADRQDALTNDPRIAQFNKLLTDPTTNPDELDAIKNKLNERKDSVNNVFKVWEELGKIKDGQKMYKMTRQFYKDAGALTRTLLDRYIDSLGLEGETSDPTSPKGRLMLSVRRMYEDSEFKGVEEYFPFMRHGDFALEVQGPIGREVHHFDTNRLRRRYISRRAQQMGVSSKDGNIFRTYLENRDTRDAFAAESRMLTDMFNAIEEATETPSFNKEALKDELYQVYLSTLPEASFRKRYMHAENVPGFSSDIFRNFKVSAAQIASQSAKLRYAPELNNAVQRAIDTLEGMPPAKQSELTPFVEEMKLRAKQELSPQELHWASSALTTGTYYFLLSGVGSAIVQTTSLPMYVMPKLNVDYGYGKAAGKFLRWMNAYKSLGYHTEDVDGIESITAPTMGESSLVRNSPLLQRAYGEAMARNILSQSYGNAITDRRQSPTNAADTTVRLAKRATAKMLSGLFTGSERLTREASFMMTFELDYEKHGDFDRAVNKAADVVHEMLGRFDTFGRPRIMRGSIGSPLFQFRPYSAGLTSLFLRNARTAIQLKSNPKEARAAWHLLANIYLMGAVMYGAGGMAGYTVICSIIDALLDQLEDEEKILNRALKKIHPKTAEKYTTDKEDRISNNPLSATSSDLRFRYEFLPRFFGGLKIPGRNGAEYDLASIAEKGLFPVLSDADIGSRVGVDGTWYKTPKVGKNLTEDVVNYLGVLAPAFTSVGANVIRGIEDINDDKLQRGLEALFPKGISNPIKTERVGEEGITTRKGAEILSKDEISQLNMAWQVLGVQPTRAAQLQEQAFKANAEVIRAEDAKNDLLKKLNDVFLSPKSTEEDQQKIMNRIAQHNRRYPMEGLAIFDDTISRSIDTAIENRALTFRGMQIKENLLPYLLPMRQQLDEAISKRK